MGGYPNTTMNPTPSPTGGSGNIWSLLGGLGSIGADLIRNKQSKNREKDRRKYDLEQWKRVQAYNHPLEQMKRLKDAGLNPNLIYGSSPGSAVGNAGAIPAGQAPDYRLTNPVTGYMDTRVKQAQTNNLKTQSNLNTANAMKSVAQSGLAKEQTNQIQKLLSGQYEIQQEQVKQSKIGTFLKTLEKTGKSKNYLAQQAALTNKMIADGNIQQAGVELAKLNERLAKQGIRPTDPLYIKLLGQIFGMDLTNPTVSDQKNLRTFLQYLNK
jgi:hypothetical protein